MKTVKAFAILLAASGLTACSRDVATPGNPNQMSYAGEPGSTYDRAANPPRDIGQVSYNPASPFVSSFQVQPSATPQPPAVTTAPLAPLPR